MKAFETSATVEAQGRVQIVGVPLPAGTEVEVSISPKRSAANEFAAAWKRVCTELRAGPGAQTISDEDISKEVSRYRSGQ